MGKMVEGKVVVVTGSGAGIGRDFALAFAASGAKVVVNDVSPAKEGQPPAAEQVVAEIKALGGEAVASQDSVAAPDTASKIVQAALDTFGRIDCVVNNAGIVRDRFFFNMSVDEWKAVVDVHLNGSFYVARAAAPHFKQQNSGSYVHMTSTSGLIGNLGQANYSAAKMGVAGLSKSIALDMAKFNVRSNCIAPWAWTAMTATIPADTPANIARIEKMKKMESGQDRAARRLPGQRPGRQGQRPDLRRACQRDLLLQPDPHDAFRAPLRGLDARVHRRTRDARVRVELLSERALDGPHALGPDLT